MELAFFTRTKTGTRWDLGVLAHAIRRSRKQIGAAKTRTPAARTGRHHDPRACSARRRSAADRRRRARRPTFHRLRYGVESPLSRFQLTPRQVQGRALLVATPTDAQRIRRAEEYTHASNGAIRLRRACGVRPRPDRRKRRVDDRRGDRLDRAPKNEWATASPVSSVQCLAHLASSHYLLPPNDDSNLDGH